MEVKELPSSSMVPSFARGLNILLVDYDTTSLMYIASMLEQYSYKVTTTELASVALLMIREEKDRFELVIANVDMPDMDMLSFLRVLLKKEIPIMLMGSQRNLSVAAKALAEGACFFLEKPISFDDLKNIWQHVYRRRNAGPLEGIPKADRGMVNHGKAFQGVKMKEQAGNDLQYSCSNQHILADRKGKNKQIMEVDLDQVVLDIVDENSIEELNDTCTEQLMMMTRQSRKQGGITTKIRSLSDDEEGKRKGNKRKLDSDNQEINYKNLKHFEEILEEMIENKEEIEKEMNGHDGSSGKKRSQRLSWTPELHHKFTAAISALGDRKARPKLILKMMNVPHLTQRQVSSHLQKYKTQIQRIAENATNDLASVKKLLSIHEYTSTGSLQTVENIKYSSTSQAGHKSSHNIAMGGPTLGAGIVAGRCTSGSSGNYVPNIGKSPRDFTDALAPKTAVSAPPRRSLNPNQPSAEYADHLLKLLDEGEEELTGLDIGLDPGDVDRYYEWLTGALLENSELP